MCCTVSHRRTTPKINDQNHSNNLPSTPIRAGDGREGWIRKDSVAHGCPIRSRKFGTIEFLLELLPESHRLDAVNIRDERTDKTVLHYAVGSNDVESVNTILALYPESQHLDVINMQDVDRRTVLHHAVTVAGNYAIIRLLLNSLTESERVQAVNVTDNDGSTVLQLAKSFATRNFIRKLVRSSHASSCTVL